MLQVHLSILRIFAKNWIVLEHLTVHRMAPRADRQWQLHRTPNNDFQYQDTQGIDVKWLRQWSDIVIQVSDTLLVYLHCFCYKVEVLLRVVLDLLRHNDLLFLPKYENAAKVDQLDALDPLAVAGELDQNIFGP